MVVSLCNMYEIGDTYRLFRPYKKKYCMIYTSLVIRTHKESFGKHLHLRLLVKLCSYLYEWYNVHSV
jgi:hypothetical protein